MSKSIFKELNSVKYLMLGGHRIDVKVSPFYTFDRYKKQVSCLLTFYWNNPSDDILLFYLQTGSSRGITKTSGEINMKNNTSKSMVISFSQSEMTGNSLYIILDMNVKRKVDVKKTIERHYTTGILWWKEYHSYDEDITVKEQKTVDYQRIHLRQTLRQEVDNLRI